ncbi:hypothetical protein DXG01_008384 [Tephrocybe rancida]|nr:hypothetical protein DXG01_008384 [Tephrocybe rancida]
MTTEVATDSTILSSPPFVVVPGVINIRALGGASSLSPQTRIKPLHVFRSGELTRVDERGQSALRELGITTVFDLRSDGEIKRYESTTPDIPGIQVVRAPALTDDAWNADLTELLQRYKDEELNTHVEFYAKILEMAGPSYGLIFAHLRDKPSEPCLVHCTVGKDRTGVFAALFYLLLGANDADIASDYALTAAGLAPSAKAMEARFRAVPAFQENWEGFTKMGSSRAETMAAVVPMIREKFGGAEGYLKSHAGLTDDDLRIIRENLLIRDEQASE